MDRRFEVRLRLHDILGNGGRTIRQRHSPQSSVQFRRWTTTIGNEGTGEPGDGRYTERIPVSISTVSQLCRWTVTCSLGFAQDKRPESLITYLWKDINISSLF